MFHYRWVVWLLLVTGGLLAQMPLRVSSHKLAEVVVTATERHLTVDLVIA